MSPRRVTRLAYRMWEDYGDAIDLGELDGIIVGVLSHCFAKFDPERRSPGSSPEDFFVKFFRYCLKRVFRDLKRDRRIADRQRASLKYAKWKASLPRRSREEDAFEDWSHFFYDIASQRLGGHLRQFINLRYIRRKTRRKIADEMTIPERTLRRRYGTEQIAHHIQQEIREMILNLPHQNMEELLYQLHYMDRMSEENVARLLCLPLEDVNRMMRAMLKRIINEINRDALREQMLRKIKQ